MSLRRRRRTSWSSLGSTTATSPLSRPTDSELAGRLMADAAQVAADLGLTEFRLVLNTGATAGQSVFHVHAHLMAGRDFGWPPG